MVCAHCLVPQEQQSRCVIPRPNLWWYTNWVISITDWTLWSWEPLAPITGNRVLPEVAISSHHMDLFKQPLDRTQSPYSPNWCWSCHGNPAVTIHTDSFLFFPHLLHSDSYLSCSWLIAPTLAPLWLISLTLVTHRSHTYSTITHSPLLYFYYIYG